MSISPAEPGSLARQPNRCSTAKSIKQLRNINGPSVVPVSIGRKAKSKGCIVRRFLKITVEVAERTDSEWEVVPKRRGTGVKRPHAPIGVGPRDRPRVIPLV